MLFTDEQGYKSVDYSRLTPVIVETIKEQRKQLEELSKKLMALEKLVNKYTDKIINNYQLWVFARP